MKKSQLEIINFLYEEEQRLWKVFMDKSLSELVYVKVWEDISQLYVFVPDIKYKIIGHYWLDSILKYIDECNFWSIRITEYEIVTSLWDKNACIPNKSPNLYTDEENKSLLKLLKQLWENTQ